MCGDTNTNIHILLVCCWHSDMITCVQTLRHTHTRLCNGVKFYDSTQNFANTALWFAAKLPFSPPPPSTLWARSLAFTSSHLSAFYQPLLPLLAPYFFHPIHPTTMLFILSFLSLLASLFSSSPTSICPSVSAFLFKYFTFIIFYFFFQCFLSPVRHFPPKTSYMFCKYFILLISSFYISHEQKRPPIIFHALCKVSIFSSVWPWLFLYRFPSCLTYKNVLTLFAFFPGKDDTFRPFKHALVWFNIKEFRCYYWVSLRRMLHYGAHYSAKPSRTNSRYFLSHCDRSPPCCFP